MIISFDDLAAIRQKHKNQKIVLTSGTFDLLHVGHLDYLEAVKAYGEVLVVLMSSDIRVRARKGHSRPIIPEGQRARMLDALRPVDYVLVDPGATPASESGPEHLEIVDQLQPDMYVTDGPDPRFWGIMEQSKLKIINWDERAISTTDIIAKIRKT